MRFIQETIDEFVSQNREFTAFDISKAVQKKLDDALEPRVPHNFMKDTIHALMQNVSDYDSHFHDFGAFQAIKYYPKNLQQVVQNDPVQNYGKNDLLVPANCLKALGISKGDFVELVLNNDGKGQRFYVDDVNNFKISAQVLESNGLDATKSYLFSVTDNEISVV